MSIIRSTISLTQRWPPPFRSFAFSSARKKTQQPLVLSEYHKNSFKQRLSFNVFFIVGVVRQRCVGMYIIFCRCVGYVIIIEGVGKLEVEIRRHLRFFFLIDSITKTYFSTLSGTLFQIWLFLFEITADPSSVQDVELI